MPNLYKKFKKCTIREFLLILLSIFVGIIIFFGYYRYQVFSYNTYLKTIYNVLPSDSKRFFGPIIGKNIDLNISEITDKSVKLSYKLNKKDYNATFYSENNDKYEDMTFLVEEIKRREYQLKIYTKDSYTLAFFGGAILYVLTMVWRIVSFMWNTIFPIDS